MTGRLVPLLRWIGWRLMGIPVGIREPSSILLRYGPYRLGAYLASL